MDPSPLSDSAAAAEAAREACIREALRAWEDAGVSGLCHEGRFEVVIGALRTLDLAAALRPSRDGAR